MEYSFHSHNVVFESPRESTTRIYDLYTQNSYVVEEAIARSPLSRFAHILLPAASWAETSGTFTLYDGGKLTLRKALPPLCGFSNVEIWHQLMDKPD